MADSRRVQVLTDSATDVPPSLQDLYDIDVVPLSVTIADETFLDGVDITPERLMTRMRSSKVLPTTSQPSSAQFADAFREALAQGKDVACVVVSSDVSGTFNAARIAAEDVDPARIRVIDSRGATMQAGWVAVAAARAAQRGEELDAVCEAATNAIGHSQLLAVLKTLDNLYKGGRIGRAQHMIGSALSIKPILGIVDGVVAPLEHARTWKRATKRAIELVSRLGEPTDIAVLHADNLPDAQSIAEVLQKAFPKASMTIGWAGSVIMTHAGPGAIGIATLSGDA